MLISFPLAGLVIYNIKETTYTEEKTVFVEDVQAAHAEAGVAEKSGASSHEADVDEKVDH